MSKMRISRTRAGRKSWNTRNQYNRAVGEAFRAIANSPEQKYGAVVTRAMIIERTAGGKREVISFSTAYGELSMWLNVAFCDYSEFGLSDMLAETFFQGAVIRTLKAEYRLWISPKQVDETEETFFQSGEIDRYYQDLV